MAQPKKVQGLIRGHRSTQQTPLEERWEKFGHISRTLSTGPIERQERCSQAPLTSFLKAFHQRKASSSVNRKVCFEKGRKIKEGVEGGGGGGCIACQTVLNFSSLLPGSKASPTRALNRMHKSPNINKK